AMSDRLCLQLLFEPRIPMPLGWGVRQSIPALFYSEVSHQISTVGCIRLNSLRDDAGVIKSCK
ncbi:hypothetical protein, partial [Trichormus variabilis]|uniref:hypothetical protein n=1 Tax=Anabaena variabilis TaxID=264691 RepID=UPI001A7EAB13